MPSGTKKSRLEALASWLAAHRETVESVASILRVVLARAMSAGAEGRQFTVRAGRLPS
jgi:hypothetical protein